MEKEGAGYKLRRKLEKKKIGKVRRELEKWGIAKVRQGMDKDTHSTFPLHIPDNSRY